MEISRSISVCVGKDLEMAPTASYCSERNLITQDRKVGFEMHGQWEWQSLFNSCDKKQTNYTEQSNIGHSNW